MNFKNILSKSSLGSSTSSKSSNQSEEITKLQNEIESLTQNVSSLKNLLESRDSAIGALAREKEKFYVELKSMQRTNKHLQRQLLYEREMHIKDKNYLIDNIKQLSQKYTTNELFNKQINDEDPCLCALQNELISKEEVIFTLCSKYLKLKKYKCFLQNKYEALQRNCREVCQNVIKILKDNRNSINSFLNDLAKSAISSSQEKYNINLVKVNNDLQFENIQLKLYQISKIYLDECNKQEESDINIPGRSFQNFNNYGWNNYESNQGKTKSLRAKKKQRSTINMKNSHNTIYFHKSVSDSDLHRHIYR